MLGRTTLGFAVVAMLAGSAFAAEMDLTVQVKTARPTTVSPMRWGVDAWPSAAAWGQSPPGDDGTTPVELTFHVSTPRNGRVFTPFGEFSFSVGVDGTISAPAGSLLSVSGTTLTLNNAIDLPDFGVRMRRTTTLNAVQLTPALLPGTPVASSILPGSQLLTGAQADTAVRWPLNGVTPGTSFRISTTMGPSFVARITAAGGLSVDADPAALPVSVDAADPQVLVIENTIDLPDFAMRMAKPTTVSTVQYRVRTSWEEFAHFPAPGFPPNAIHQGLAAVPGATADVNAVALPLMGLAANETISFQSILGGAAYRVRPDGTLEAVGDDSRIAWDGPVAVVQNLLDFPGFRIRLQQPCNATNVRMTFFTINGWGSAIYVGPSEFQYVAGSDSDEGIAFPLMGVAPVMFLGVSTPIAGVYFQVGPDGSMEVTTVGSPPPGRIVQIDGGPQLVIDNPISVRCKVYGENPVPGITFPPSGIWVILHFTYAYSPIDADPFGDAAGMKSVLGADWPTGVEFRLEGMGPYTGLASTGGFGPNNARTIAFNLNPDGTATFPAPGRNVTPWKGALDIDVDNDGTNDNVYYVEIAPLNAAPTATLSTGNFTIASSAQTSTVVSAAVAATARAQITWPRLVGDLQGAGPPAPPDGATSLDLGTLPPLGVGTHVIRLEVSDGELAAMPEVVVTVENSPPEAVTSGGGVYEIGAGSGVTLAGTVADFDGDLLAYEWRLQDGTLLASGVIDTMDGGAPVAVPPHEIGTLALGVGVHTLTLAVEDEENDPVLATAVVEVKDTTGPTLAPAADRSLLWPPDHRMVDVVVLANATDASGGALTYAVVVTSDEPPEFDGSGNFLPDHEVVSIDPATGEIRLRLRAERSGKGDGRLYTILVTVTDASGNVSTATLEVKAPHDRRSQ